jgi:protein TonB
MRDGWRSASDGLRSRWSASFAVALAAHAGVFALLAGTAVVRLDLVPTTIDLAFLDASDRSAGPGERAPELRVAATLSADAPPAQPAEAAPPAPRAEAAPPAPPAEAAPPPPAPEIARADPAPEPVPAPPKPAESERIARPVAKSAAREASPARPAAPAPPQPALPAPVEGAGTQAATGSSRTGGSDTRSTAPAWAATARVRYEQVLFAWMNRHKQYPMLAQRRGIEGEGSVRVRIDRDGRVLERSVARSTGEQMLDQAALDMVRRANPFPAVPSEYAGETFEFVAPIQYRLR